MSQLYKEYEQRRYVEKHWLDYYSKTSVQTRQNHLFKLRQSKQELDFVKRSQFHVLIYLNLQDQISMERETLLEKFRRKLGLARLPEFFELEGKPELKLEINPQDYFSVQFQTGDLILSKHWYLVSSPTQAFRIDNSEPLKSEKMTQLIEDWNLSREEIAATWPKLFL